MKKSIIAGGWSHMTFSKSEVENQVGVGSFPYDKTRSP